MRYLLEMMHDSLHEIELPALHDRHTGLCIFYFILFRGSRVRPALNYNAHHRLEAHSASESVGQSVVFHAFHRNDPSRIIQTTHFSIVQTLNR